MECRRPRHMGQHVGQQKQAKQSYSDNVTRVSAPLTQKSHTAGQY